MLSVEAVAKAMPANLKGNVTQALVDRINNAVSDPIVAEQIRDNFISYTQVLQDGRFKTEDYLHAVMYVSYKLMGQTNLDAYVKTFPQRYTALVAAGTSSKDIASYVAAYNKGKLVNAILEQTLVPTWVLNQHLYQQALNTQADLMMNAQSEMVRTTAANSILTHLAKPKEAGPLVNIDMRETSGMDELKNAMVSLARQQQEMINSGISPKVVAEQKLVGGEKDVN